MNAFDVVRFLSGMGAVTPEHRKQMSKKSQMILVSPESLPVIPFPANDSVEAREELYALSKIRVSKDDIEFMKVVDTDIAAPFLDYARENDLPVSRELLKKIMDDAVPFILELKYAYSRPRPVQLAYMYGIELNPYPSKTADTPSYPSGHAFQAYLVAYAIGAMYPAHMKALEGIAKRVGQSRVNMKVHFPSDIEAGRVFAKIASQSIALDK
jgi:acid phosphatase (class A)